MPTRDFLLPQSLGLTERVATWAANPGEPVAIKPAATVMLLRDGERGVEVFVQRRVASMAFAPRMTVFPGGSVDPGDREPPAWSGPTPADWSAVLGCPEPDASALVTAAIRELFEEAGVLLAAPTDSRVTAAEAIDAAAADVSGPDYATSRGRLLTRELTLAQLLATHGLRARTDLLGYHAHWITPELEPRRYDTYFFTALLPAGQQADAETTEAEIADWVVAADILREATDSLMPPTRVCLGAIAAAGRAADLVGVRAPVPVVMPVPVLTEAGWAMRADLP